MTNKFVATSINVPLQHKLVVDSHSPRRHGHNLKITLKVKHQDLTSSFINQDYTNWLEQFKLQLIKNLTFKFEEVSEQQTTEMIMLHVVEQINSDPQFIWDLNEVRIQETAKNQFVWTKSKK